MSRSRSARQPKTKARRQLRACSNVKAAHKAGTDAHHRPLALAALRLGKRLGCEWAKGGK